MKKQKILSIDLGQRVLVSATSDKNVFIFKGTFLKYLNEKRAELEEINTRIAIRQLQKKQTDVLEHEREELVKHTNTFFVSQLTDILSDLDLTQYTHIAIEDIAELNNLYKDLNNVYRNILWNAPLLAYHIIETCKLNNIHVIMVHPSGTSSTCPKCKIHDYKSRDKKNNKFICTSCKHESIPDMVAVCNIYDKAMEIINGKANE